MGDFRAAEDHGPIREVFPDVFMVTGGFRFAPLLGITRNMFVIRQGEELVVVSTIRLSPEGEAELDKLGKVKHVVRIGGFHGADDPYYLDRYKATFWAPAGLKDAAKDDRVLAPGESPLEESDVILFEKGQMPEAVIVLKREGGILISADSFQNWTNFEGCTFFGGLMMRAMGFGPTIVGGPWVKRQGSAISADFERILEAEFKHALPGHGAVLKDEAKAGVRKAVKSRLG